jgi:O-6-methylguanine DNA methyltransferase
MGQYFKKKVWEALLSIKYGQTKYYSDIANDLNSSPRAVGNACGNNKCLIVIPCHRVISKNPRSSSYEGIIHKDILLKNELKNQ